jgi:hypothetical protein
MFENEHPNFGNEVSAQALQDGNQQESTMKTSAFTLAAVLAVSGAFFSSAGAVEVCDKTCVGPACAKDCVREPDVTVGRDRRDRNEVIIEERNRRREPAIELRERERRPGVDVEINRRPGVDVEINR